MSDEPTEIPEELKDAEKLSARWDERDTNGRTRRETILKSLKKGETSEALSATNTKDLRFLHLENENLTGVDLSGTDLTGANLNGANLSRANLQDANLYMTKIEKAEFLGANLTKAQFIKCQASYAGFGASILTRTSFFQSTLEGATFSRATIHEADFRATHLTRARIRDADLTNSDFTKANLQKCDLGGTNVQNARFTDVDFQDASLKGVRNFKTANWIGTDIRNVDFHGAYLVRRYIMDENYLYEFRSQSKLNEIIFKIWLITSDCGRSFGRWAFFVSLITLLFAVLYLFADIDFGKHEPNFLSSLYFSVITISTLGYGEITPNSPVGQILSILEVTIGYCSLGGLLSIFATKMGRRAD